MMPVPNVTWPLPPTEVESRSVSRVMVVQRRKLLVCACLQPNDEVAKLTSVQALFNTDHCGPTGIEHRVIHPEEALPILFINYANKPLIIQATFRCFDITDMPFKKACHLYAGWLQLNREN